MRRVTYVVTLVVPIGMPNAEVREFVTTALKSEPGHHRPEDPKSEVTVWSIMPGRVPCG